MPRLSGVWRWRGAVFCGFVLGACGEEGDLSLGESEDPLTAVGDDTPKQSLTEEEEEEEAQPILPTTPVAKENTPVAGEHQACVDMEVACISYCNKRYPGPGVSNGYFRCLLGCADTAARCNAKATRAQ